MDLTDVCFMPLVALQFLGVRQTNSEDVPLTFLQPFAFFFGVKFTKRKTKNLSPPLHGLSQSWAIIQLMVT